MMKMTFSLACSLVLGGVSVLSVASCDKDDEMPSLPVTPTAKSVDGQWQSPQATPHPILSDESVTRVNEDYFNGKLPEDSTSVIGGFVVPGGLTVTGTTSGKETRLACTVTGRTFSLADVTPQDSTFYKLNAAKSAVVRGLSRVKVEGVDAAGHAHDVSASAWLVTTTPQELIETHKGSNRVPRRLLLPFISPEGYKWMDARFTLVLPTEALKDYSTVKVTLVRSNTTTVESVWKRG